MTSVFTAIHNRLPTRYDSFLVFSACIFPINFWITLVFLYSFPALIMRGTIWEALGVLAYMYAFALLESLILFSFIVILSVILPGNILRERFAYVGTSLAFIICISAILLNAPLPQTLVWYQYLIISILVMYLIYIIRKPADRVQRSAVAERITVISSLFIFLNLTSVIYILFRQL